MNNINMESGRAGFSLWASASTHVLSLLISFWNECAAATTPRLACLSVQAGDFSFVLSTLLLPAVAWLLS